jgi:hypothetical protein
MQSTLEGEFTSASDTYFVAYLSTENNKVQFIQAIKQTFPAQIEHPSLPFAGRRCRSEKQGVCDQLYRT